MIKNIKNNKKKGPRALKKRKNPWGAHKGIPFSQDLTTAQSWDSQVPPCRNYGEKFKIAGLDLI